MKTFTKSTIGAIIMVNMLSASALSYAETVKRIGQHQHISIENNKVKIPRSEQQQRLVNEINNKPDLIPLVDQFDRQGIVKVRNIGNKKSAKSFLNIDCDHQDKSRCPELDKKYQTRYSVSGYGDDFMVRIPELNPGQTYSHRLPFWRELTWGPGHYVISFQADATNSNNELNERNNIAQHTLAR